MANLACVIGTSGGAGASTVAAHLAAARAARKKDALALDFCPNNVLRLHFAMPWEDETGFAPALLNGSAWHEAAYCSAGGTSFIPFGQLQDDAELALLTKILAEQPDWLAQRLNEIELTPDALVVCDCPHAFPALHQQALQLADQVLIVMTPDPLSYAHATQMAMAATDGPEISILLNGFNPARELDRDILALLRANFGGQLAPVIIHQDESLREAFACKRTVLEFAPSSQAAYEFQALATWLAAHLAHKSGVQA